MKQDQNLHQWQHQSRLSLDLSSYCIMTLGELCHFPSPLTGGIRTGMFALKFATCKILGLRRTVINKERFDI